MTKVNKIASKDFNSMAELRNYVNANETNIINIETMYESVETSYGVYQTRVDVYRLHYYDAIKVEGAKMCRLCANIRQSKYGHIFCVQNDQDKGLNEECNIDKFVVDVKLKDLVKGEW
ncbi:MAG: hypothetical protein ACRC23_02095 [Aeromonas jandaei]